jgi:TPR repeat protein
MSAHSVDEADDIDSQYDLGVALYERGSKASLAEAEIRWRRAAASGHVNAQYNLGILLYERDGDQSTVQVESWWRRAAEAGHVGAQYNLGTLLELRGDVEGAEL